MPRRIEALVRSYVEKEHTISALSCIVASRKRRHPALEPHMFSRACCVCVRAQTHAPAVLAVAPANVPLMNSPAMRLAKEVDAAGLRTIGVLTKVDTLKQSDDQRDLKAAVVNCVTNNGQGGAYPLRTHGYVAVMTNPLYGSVRALGQRGVTRG